MEDEKKTTKKLFDDLLSEILKREPKLKEIYHIFFLSKADIAINASSKEPLKKSDSFAEINERAETSTTASSILHAITKTKANSLFQGIWCEGISLYVPVFNHAGDHFAFFSITPRNYVKTKDFYTNFNLLLSAIETVLNRNNLLIEK